LIGLLLLLTGRHLGLSSRNLSSLVLHAKVGGIHATSLCNASSLSGIAEDVLANASGGLRTLKALRKLLVAEALNGLTLPDILCIQVLADLTQLRASAKVLLETLLAKLAILSASAEGLTILLLTKSREASADAELLGILLLTKGCSLLGRLLLGGAICLSCPEANALLLLGGRKGLLVVGLIETANSLAHCKSLLLGKVRLCNTGTITAKSASLNGVTLHLPALLTLLLL
jgi:hypothetical protein